jgi:virulence-associated protein VapD
MFLKEKFDSTGKFEKLKARLVANGNMQDKTLYNDMSSPTAATSSVFTIAAIAAYEGRGVNTLDINGAYLNANMHTTGNEVYMRLDGTSLDVLCEIDEDYKQYVIKYDKGDYIVVNLDKALYGCVESAKLWYDDLKQTLNKAGFIANTIDGCVFNKGIGVNQCTVVLHVDDMLITSRNVKDRTELIAALESRYTEGVTMHEGPKISYLGMTFDWSIKGEVSITQEGYICEMLENSGVIGEAKTPAASNLYETRDEIELVSDEMKEWYHCQVAKLLYLAKRTRPECLTAVAYLTTRVTKCNIDDVVKLVRLIRYIRKTREMGIILRPGSGGLKVNCYVDAAYGLHSDGKSVTGSVITIGDAGPVHAKSVKQKIVTKSSTEAEFVAASDSANQALHVRQLLISQGHDQHPVKMFQDNLSCMALISKGRASSERTRHMSIRYFWINERVSNKEINIEHLGTEKMFANILTKPIQGSQFTGERKMLTNWNRDV